MAPVPVPTPVNDTHVPLLRPSKSLPVQRMVPSLDVSVVPTFTAPLTSSFSKGASTPIPTLEFASTIKSDVLKLLSLIRKNGSVPPCVTISNLASGEEVPRPTCPSASINKELSAAPGRILRGNVLLVSSLIKKLLSFPPTSHACGVKPSETSCSNLIVVLFPSTTCKSTTGASVPMPICPAASITREFALAPAMVLNGMVFPFSSSTMAKWFSPPLVDSFACSIQLLEGKLLPALLSLLSSNFILRLFSLSISVLKPKFSKVVTSRPIPKLP